jgi:spore coat protein H
VSLVIRSDGRKTAWPKRFGLRRTLLRHRLGRRPLRSTLLMVGIALGAALAAPGQTGADKPGPQGADERSNLPMVILQAGEPFAPDRRTPCTVKIVPAGSRDRSTNGLLPAAARIHGATSQGHPKKSFGLTLEAPATLLGMRESRHWILNAAYIDRSLMRHKLSFDLFRSLSAPGRGRWAVASRFVELRFNGSYHGVYLLMERVDRQLLELRAYHSNDFSHACIYKAVDHAANFGQAGWAGYEQREPEPTLRSYWQPLDEFNRFVSSAPAAAFLDPQTGIAARLDLDNAIDFHLLVLLTSNSDGITKNFFLARNGQETGPLQERFFFVPWDYDGTFGRNWDASVFPATAWLSNNLFDRLLEDPAYRARFVARWNRLREGPFSAGTIQGLIDLNLRTLGEAARRNAIRWPVGDGPYPDQLSFAQDAAQMKAWMEAHLQWLDREINQRFGAKGG